MRTSVVTVVVLLAASISSVAQFTLIPRNATWKYLPSGPAPTNWQRLEFNDNAWMTGPAQLGYGDGDEQTGIAYDPMAAPTALYFRHAFTLADRAAITSTTLRVLADDGAVVYVNGLEAIRRNMPAGVISDFTAAISNIETNENQFVQFGITPGYLRQGDNLVAVEVHQHIAGRHDASFDFELLVNLPGGLPTITILNPTNQAVLDAGGIWIEAAASDSAGHIRYVEFYTNGVLLARLTSEPYRYFWLSPPLGRHIIEARAFNGIYDFNNSPPVHVQVGGGSGIRLVTGPYLQCGSPTNMTLRWRTDWPCDSVVSFGTSLEDMGRAVTNTAPAIDHELNITGLEPDTTYFYSIGSTSETLSMGGHFHFRTSPTATRPVRVWIVGDSGTGDQYAADVRDAYYANAPSVRTDLMLMLGDNAYGNGLYRDYESLVFNLYADLLRNTVVWPTIGNHDAGDVIPGRPALYLANFTLPRNGEAGGIASGTELYYSFDYANVHFICLDSYVSDRATNSPMLAWLEGDLAATAKDWIIAYWHHPPYSKGTHDSDGDPFMTEMRERALPVLEEHGVDLVLCGHSHVYERSFLLNGHYGYSWTLGPSMVLDAGLGRPDIGGAYQKPAGGLGVHQGTVYAVCGCSGEGGITSFPRHSAIAVNQGGFGSMILEIDALQLKASFLRPSGKIDDTFVIDKSSPARIGPELSITTVTNGASISWPTSKPAFLLEWADTIPATLWQPVPQAPRTAGRRNLVTVETTGPMRFYQLRSQP